MRLCHEFFYFFIRSFEPSPHLLTRLVGIMIIGGHRPLSRKSSNKVSSDCRPVFRSCYPFLLSALRAGRCQCYQSQSGNRALRFVPLLFEWGVSARCWCLLSAHCPRSLPDLLPCCCSPPLSHLRLFFPLPTLSENGEVRSIIMSGQCVLSRLSACSTFVVLLAACLFALFLCAWCLHCVSFSPWEC